MYNFAVCLAEGFGVEKDEAKAAQIFRRAADNVIDAQHRYGRMLAEGRGVARDFVEARVWLEKACTVDAPDALNDLAALYLQGLGGPADPEAAFGLFQRSAAKGNVQAMFALGALLGGGNGVAVDRAASLAWYQRAADAGNARAALMLGKYYKMGIATAPNPDEARKYLTRALQAGLAEAQAELDGMDAPQAPAP
jgi:TPR repeat protein